MNINKIQKYFKSKKIIVTGGTGLIGRNVVSKLCDYGAKVTVVSLDNIKGDKRAKYIFGDLTDFEFCRKITKNKDFAFHMAGIKGSVKVTIEKPAENCTGRCFSALKNGKLLTCDTNALSIETFKAIFLEKNASKSNPAE